MSEITDKQVQSLLRVLDEHGGEIRTDHSVYNKHNLEIIAEAERRGLVISEVEIHYEQQWSSVIVRKVTTMTPPNLKAIRERAEKWGSFYASQTNAGKMARDVLALLDLIEKPDEKAVERAICLEVVMWKSLPCKEICPSCVAQARAALIAAYTEE